MSSAIPASINYQDVLPVAVPAIARRRRFYPQNGTQFDNVGTSEIRVEIGSVNSLLDPQHSYIEFFVRNITAPAQTCGFDLGGGHVLFDEVWVEQGGRVLARQQAHNRLHAGILSACQVSENGQLTESITQGQRGLNSGAGGGGAQLAPFPQPASTGEQYVNRAHNTDVQVPNNGEVRMTMAMPTGLFTQDKLIPLPLVNPNEPITLVFSMDIAPNVGVWSGNPGFGGLQINRFNYVAQLIEVGGDVLGQLRQMRDMSGGQLTISTTDIEHSQGNVVANFNGEAMIRVPARRRSIKSLLFQCNSDDITNGPGGMQIWDFFNLSFGGSMNMTNYQLKCGSVVYPPQPVEAWGNNALNAAGLQKGECVMELAKAIGTLGYTNPTGRLSSTTYCVNTNTPAGVAAGPNADGDNGDGANIIAPAQGQITSVCPFGLDLESFQHTAIESGVDTETMALETTLMINIGVITIGAEAKNVHTYLIYDQHYYFNADGSITFSN